jgi:hypothetical protein
MNHAHRSCPPVDVRSPAIALSAYTTRRARGSAGSLISRSTSARLYVAAARHSGSLSTFGGNSGYLVAATGETIDASPIQRYRDRSACRAPACQCVRDSAAGHAGSHQLDAGHTGLAERHPVSGRTDGDTFVITSWPWGGDDLLLLEDVLWTWTRVLHAEHAIAAVKVTWAPGGPPSSL